MRKVLFLVACCGAVCFGFAPPTLPRYHPQLSGFGKRNSNVVRHVQQLGNIFGESSSSSSIDIDNSPESVFNRAKLVLATDLGVQDSSLLAEEFRWIGPVSSLNKQEYVAAGNFFDVRSAFPDLDYRAHDFRLDANDPLTVRLTARTVGTMRGNLRLRKETLPANGRRMMCPPEAISITFDAESGLVSKLCSGMTMDRLVGNTAGLCGVMAAAYIGGAPPSEWELYPPLSVVGRFFARPESQLSSEGSSFLAPFPETVMIQLAKGIIAAENGAKDPDLLSDGFTFTGPIVSVNSKKQFVKSFGDFNLKQAFPDLEVDYSNFRVDPYDPYRVWVDAKGTGTRTGILNGQEPTGLKYDGPPEAASFTFDDEGFCSRLTAGVVMDPSKGNTGGLGGVFGIFDATGSPLPGIATRPLPQILQRLQRRILSPITKQNVDGSYTKPEPLPSTTNKPLKIPVPPTTQPPKTIFPKSLPTLDVKSLTKKKKTKVKKKKTTSSTTKSDPTNSFPTLFAKPTLKTKKPSSPLTTSTTDTVKEDIAAKAKEAKENAAKEANEAKEAKAREAANAREARDKAAAEAKKAKDKAAAEAKKARDMAATEAKESRDKDAAKVKSSQQDAKAKAEEKAAKARAEREASAKAAAEAKAKATTAAIEAKAKAAAEAKGAKGRAAAEATEAKAKAATEAREAKARAATEAREAKARAAAEAREAKAKAAAEAKEAKARAAAEAREAKAKAAAEAKAKAEEAKKAKAEKAAEAREAKTRAAAEAKAAAAEAKGRAATKATKLKSAPKGIPTLSRWRQNKDKSISGEVSNSPGFDNGEEITTSSIASGDIGSGSVVTTQSGSKYFLK